MNTLQKRLTEAFKEAKESGEKIRKTDLWKAAGVSSASVTFWFNGQSQTMAWEHAQKIAPLLGVEPQWLYSGEGPKKKISIPDGLNLVPIAVWEYPDKLPNGEFIKVPRLKLKLSAENGCGERPEIELERESPQIFRAEWIRREKLKPVSLASMTAQGSSMEPRICDGDSLLVDTANTTIIDGRVYAVLYSGELRVKRIYKRFDGGLVVQSDNEREYPRIEIPVDQTEHIRIIGRVIHLQGTGGL